jgi:hypothetical protein
VTGRLESQVSSLIDLPARTDRAVADPATAAAKLLTYCRDRHWAGHDPYDALNSRVFRALPALDARIPRLALTQLLKRSPVNIRGLLLVPPTQNPKGLALFLGAMLNLKRVGFADATELIGLLTQRIVELRSAGRPEFCWGYSFPWQTRTLLVPRWAPNLVCTTFVANALLDAYEACADRRCLDMASSSAEYILNELYWSDNDVAGFAYPLPSMRHNIHNGNFLGAALFCRVARLTGETKFLAPALKVARYSASRQRPDGAWYYGELTTQQWFDNFHTGFNLCALRAIGRDAGTDEFDRCVRLGFDFYRTRFFLDDGSPKYFHDCTFPIDIHNVAQSIITLLTFRDLDADSVRLAHTVFARAMDCMWDDKGFFYYRLLRTSTIRTSYMRWSQAWMLLAISMLVAGLTSDNGPVPRAGVRF